MSTGGTQPAVAPLESTSPNERNRRLISLWSCPIPHGSYLTSAIVQSSSLLVLVEGAPLIGPRNGRFSRVRAVFFQGRAVQERGLSNGRWPAGGLLRAAASCALETGE